MTGESPLRVALYAGIFVFRDAVSNSLGAKLDVLRRLVELGAPLEVTVFTMSSEHVGPEIRVVDSVAELFAHEEFWAADVHIFEEGMYYDLFNSVFVIPKDRPILAIEHNTTPPELIDIPESKASCERSLIQRNNMVLARHVACVSEFSVELARSVGVPDERLSVLHLPPQIAPSAPPKSVTERGGPVRLLYLGRFVRAKGIVDMLELVDRLLARGGGEITVTLAGDPRFSDAEMVRSIEHRVATAPAGAVELVLAPTDDVMAQLFDRSDVLVIPSLHEGYCVPVVEAFSFRRFVIAYDAGNLPNIAGGLARLVPTGDVDALERAVLDFAGALAGARAGGQLRVPTMRGEMDEETWFEAVQAHLEGYSAANFERRFLTVLRDLAEQSPAGVSPGVETAISNRGAQLAGVR
jgi:glycosyltransferase involved in cell wall biosynthesis